MQDLKTAMFNSKEDLEEIEKPMKVVKISS